MTTHFDLNQMLKSAKGMMEKAEENLKMLTASSEGGAGMVSATVNAKHQITQLRIDEALLKESKETIEDLIQLTINDAQRKVDEQKRDSMSAFSNLFGDDAADKL